MGCSCYLLMSPRLTLQEVWRAVTWLSLLMLHKADEGKQCGLLGYVHVMVCEGSGQLPGGKTCGNIYFVNLCELE